MHVLLSCLIVLASPFSQVGYGRHQTHQAHRAIWRWEVCRFGGLDDGGWTRREIMLTFRCFARYIPPPGGVRKAHAVATCESGPDHLDNIRDSYAGPFQQSVRYWDDRFSSIPRRILNRFDLKDDVANPRSNTVVSFLMAREDGTWTEDWPVCGYR